MATSSNLNLEGGSKNGKKRSNRTRKPNPNPTSVEPFIRGKDHNAKDLRAWAKSTGFVSAYSSEASAGNYTSEFDLEKAEPAENDKKRDPSSSEAEINPPWARRHAGNRSALELNPASGAPNPRISHTQNEMQDEGRAKEKPIGRRSGVAPPEEKKEGVDRESDDEIYPNNFIGGEDNNPAGEWHKLGELKCGLLESPGYAQLVYMSLQHYLSMAGSLIFIPLIIVPSMGGTDKDTATVISTVLLISGITTILHSCFGTRLPLVQGSSFVFLAPVMVIVNSQDYRNLTAHKFRHIMRELQGAIIVGSVIQSILGITGLMSLILRFINPVVVCPTVVAIGLAFFSYAFPQAGGCVEISVPLIGSVLLFSLYLRGVSIFGLRLFKIYAVPLSVAIAWILAFFLTTGGAYSYKGCAADIPTSNILIDACRRHVYTMRRCRTDVSDAWSGASWVRVPYPLQWGVPIFRFRTAFIMVMVSVIASVDSVGTYHATSSIVTTKPPAPAVVSRGIAMEGLCSILAGIWGTGTGSTSLTENPHTINATKIANRKTVQFGAALLILFSLFGKIGAVLASIPIALAASILCFMWGLTVALGLSTLRHTEASNSRNMIIIGVSIFVGLSVSAYVQQYEPVSSLVLPGYLVAYAGASNGPVNTGSRDLNFAINGLLSLNMVVTFVIAMVLDVTVPGSREERAFYDWSHRDDVATDVFLREEYELPTGLASLKCSSCC